MSSIVSSDSAGPEPSVPLLRIRNLHIGVEDASVPDLVSDFSFTLAQGEIIGLVGESGSGKTLTTKAAVGLLPSGVQVRSGTLEIDGVDATHFGETDWRTVHQHIAGVITQNPSTSLNPRLTVYQQISEALPEATTRRRSVRAGIVAELLADAGIAKPAVRLRQYPYELSGGVAQRVSIAIALARDPRILIADEPTTALDVTTQARIMELVETLRESRRMGVVLVSHDLDLVHDHCEKIVVMQNGAVVEADTAAAILNNPRHPYTRTLLDSTPTSMLARGVGRTRGRGPAAGSPVEPGSSTRVQSLTKTFGGNRFGIFRRRSDRPAPTVAVDRVSFDIEAGEIVGIVGESGSGKTTVARMIAGLTSPDSGTVTLGSAAGEASPAQESARAERIGFVFQDNYAAFDPRLTIGDSIADALWRQRRRLGAEAIRQRVIDGLADVGMAADLADRLPWQLSGGQRQRAGIARALMTDPTLIIADEPVSALDVTVQARILELIVNLNRERGTAFLVVSHDIGVIRLICDRVLVMKEGVVLESGATEEIAENPSHPYTAQLLSAVPGRSRRRAEQIGARHP